MGIIIDDSGVFGENIRGSPGPLVTFPWPRDINTHVLYVFEDRSKSRYTVQSMQSMC